MKQSQSKQHGLSKAAYALALAAALALLSQGRLSKGFPCGSVSFCDVAEEMCNLVSGSILRKRESSGGFTYILGVEDIFKAGPGLIGSEIDFRSSDPDLCGEPLEVGEEYVVGLVEHDPETWIVPECGPTKPLSELTQKEEDALAWDGHCEDPCISKGCHPVTQMRCCYRSSRSEVCLINTIGNAYCQKVATLPPSASPTRPPPRNPGGPM